MAKAHLLLADIYLRLSNGEIYGIYGVRVAEIRGFSGNMSYFAHEFGVQPEQIHGPPFSSSP